MAWATLGWPPGAPRVTRRHWVAIALGVLGTLAWIAGCPALAASGAVMSAPDAYAAAQAGRLVLIDIRTPEEWKETGVGKGALRLDMRRRDFSQELLRRVGGDRDAPIGLICWTGNRTTQVQKALEAQGFTRVFNVQEGMAGSAAGPGWLKRGLPTEPCAAC